MSDQEQTAERQPEQPYAVVKLPQVEKPIAFDDLESAEEWLKNEAETWKPIVKSSASKVWQFKGKPSNWSPNHEAQTAFQEFRTIKSSAKQRKQVPSESEGQRILAKLDEKHNPSYVATCTADGQFVLTLAESKGDEVAASALAMLQSGQVTANPPISSAAIEGAFRAMAYRLGWSDASEEASQFRASHTELGALLDEMKARAESEKRRQEEVWREWTKQMEADRAEQKETLQQALEGAKDQIEEHQKILNQKVELAAPLKFWRGRAKTEGKSAWWWGFGFVVVTVLVGVAAVLYLQWVLRAIPELGDSAYTFIVLTAILATIAGYFLRQLARIAISHFHLQADAQERAAIIETYLAMLEEGKGKAVTPEHRALILQQIFRRSHTGLVREDGEAMPKLEVTPRSGM